MYAEIAHINRAPLTYLNHNFIGTPKDLSISFFSSMALLLRAILDLILYIYYQKSKVWSDISGLKLTLNFYFLWKILVAVILLFQIKKINHILSEIMELLPKRQIVNRVILDLLLEQETKVDCWILSKRKNLVYLINITLLLELIIFIPQLCFYNHLSLVSILEKNSSLFIFINILFAFYYGYMVFVSIITANKYKIFLFLLRDISVNRVMDGNSSINDHEPTI